ncbi:MAG: alkaline phosphatase family protein [Pirellulales bacterium]
MRRLLLITLALLLPPINRSAGSPPTTKTRNVVIVTLDGFRWQEFFGGAEEGLIDREAGGVKDIDGLRNRYLRSTAEDRRAALLPFIWDTVAQQGQIFGDAQQQSLAVCTNGKKFSYPGYNEIFCGFGDEQIDSNGKQNNANLSVLEFLDSRPALHGRVAVFCTWDVFPFIFRSSENGLKVHAGWNPIMDEPLSTRQQATNDLMEMLPRYWPDNVFDVITCQAAREHLLRHKPRVLCIGLGETDEWGHGRRYDLYLDSAHFADRFLAELWQTLQELPDYKDATSLIVTTDHGRGGTRVNWTDHGEKVDGSEQIWMALLGPDTPALGVRQNVSVTQGQVAATVASLMGEDFNAASPRAAQPLPDVVASPNAPQE